MITDASLYFATNQSVSATATATTTIDCGQALLTTGLNGGMDLCVAVVATEEYAGSATIAVELQDCATENGTFAACATSAPVLATKLSEQPLLLKFPLAHKQFLKVRFVVSGTPSTAGKLTACITDSKDAQQLYAKEDGAFQ